MESNSYFSFTPTATMGTASFSEQRYVEVEMGPFEVIVAISHDGKFLGILQIAEKKDFRSTRQRLESSVYADVSDLYVDEPS